MKQNRLVAALLAAVFMVALVACSASSSGPKASDASLVGTWKEVSVDATYVFRADGTGSESWGGGAYDMTWELDGNTLTADFGEGDIEKYKIDLDGDILVVHIDGTDFEFTRQ